MLSQPVPDPRFATAPVRLGDELRGTRLLGLWSGLVGIALVLSLFIRAPRSGSRTEIEG